MMVVAFGVRNENNGGIYVLYAARGPRMLSANLFQRQPIPGS